MCQKNGFPCQNSSSSPAYYISKPAYRVCVDRQLDRIVDFNACYTALCSITYTTGAGEAKPNFFLSKYPSVTKLYVFFHEVPHLHNILYIRARTTGITGTVTFGFFVRKEKKTIILKNYLKKKTSLFLCINYFLLLKAPLFFPPTHLRHFRSSVDCCASASSAKLAHLDEEVCRDRHSIQEPLWPWIHFISHDTSIE